MLSRGPNPDSLTSESGQSGRPRSRKTQLMNAKNLVQLVTLAALWGGSFIFMRVVAPVLGPLLTANLRLIVAGITLIAYFRLTGFDPEWRLFWKEYLVIGTINSAVP